MAGGTGIEQVKYVAYQTGLSTSVGFEQNVYAQKTTSHVYPGPLFRDAWFKRTFETVSFEAGVGSNIGAPYIQDPEFGYYLVGIKQGSLPCKATLTRSTLLEGLATLGGLKVVTGVLMFAFLSGYQQFNLDKLLMERLYSEEVVVASGKN